MLFYVYLLFIAICYITQGGDEDMADFLASDNSDSDSEQNLLRIPKIKKKTQEIDIKAKIARKNIKKMTGIFSGDFFSVIIKKYTQVLGSYLYLRKGFRYRLQL